MVSLSQGLRHPKIHVRFEFSGIGTIVVAALAAAALILEEPAVEKTISNGSDWPIAVAAVVWWAVSRHSPLHVAWRFVIAVGPCSHCSGKLSVWLKRAKTMNVFFRPQILGWFVVGVKLGQVKRVCKRWHDSQKLTLKKYNDEENKKSFFFDLLWSEMRLELLTGRKFDLPRNFFLSVCMYVCLFQSCFYVFLFFMSLFFQSCLGLPFGDALGFLFFFFWRECSVIWPLCYISQMGERKVETGLQIYFFFSDVWCTLYA